jgi:formylglycine-generating enzyme required for sulfatase activity
MKLVRSAKSALLLLATLWVACAVPSAQAQAPVVASLSRNGELVSTNLVPGSRNDVEWAPTVNGPWTNSWAGLVNMPAGSNGDLRVSVPMFYRVRSGPATPVGPGDLTNMMLIPAGTFAMGDSLDGLAPAVPVHYVQVSDFWISRFEVTKALWDEVYNWAIQNGYSFQYSAQGEGPNHPAHSMTWYDAVKWCNARSEREGQVPAYYTSAAQTSVYRTGQLNLSNNWVKWGGGYRLPTEAEWEKAARGGVTGQRFPWGNSITHAQANYVSDAAYAYDTSATRGFNPAYNDGVYPYTSPVGTFGPNGYGLHDTTGNVWEWCWDGYDGAYYAASPETDPLGPAVGASRVLRGGSWSSYAVGARSAARNWFSPGGRFSDFGFRVVLGPALISFSVASASGLEGDSVTLTVLRQGGLGRPVSVDYQTLDGTATAGVDYTAASGTLVFGPLETTKSVSIQLLQDSRFDPSETFTVLLQNPQGGALLGNPASLTVTVSNLGGSTPPGPSMVLIAAGSFSMGDTLDGDSSALPVHAVEVGAFYMDRTEVTKAQWDEVYGWAVTNGYSFEDGALSNPPTHPAQGVHWFDAVKWCNARSEKEGWVPAYYTNAALTAVYRAGQVNVQNDWVKWTGGYRLPTEAEWEKAARGGVAGQRFGFGDTITHGQANYYSSSNYVYDVSPTRGFHPTYKNGVDSYTSPVGSFGTNGYGLYDMVGNVWELCWDYYGDYSLSPAKDPRGPAFGGDRVIRGGSWGHDAIFSRSASRNLAPPGNRGATGFGFRAVLSPGQP